MDTLFELIPTEIKEKISRYLNPYDFILLQEFLEVRTPPSFPSLKHPWIVHALNLTKEDACSSVYESYSEFLNFPIEVAKVPKWKRKLQKENIKKIKTQRDIDRRIIKILSVEASAFVYCFNQHAFLSGQILFPLENFSTESLASLFSSEYNTHSYWYKLHYQKILDHPNYKEICPNYICSWEQLDETKKRKLKEIILEIHTREELLTFFKRIIDRNCMCFSKSQSHIMALIKGIIRKELVDILSVEDAKEIASWYNCDTIKEAYEQQQAIFNEINIFFPVLVDFDRQNREKKCTIKTKVLLEL